MAQLLPPELLQRIVSLLPEDDDRKVALAVCRNWHAAVAAAPGCWPTIDLCGHLPVADEADVPALADYGLEGLVWYDSDRALSNLGTVAAVPRLGLLVDGTGPRPCPSALSARACLPACLAGGVLPSCVAPHVPRPLSPPPPAAQHAVRPPGPAASGPHAPGAGLPPLRAAASRTRALHGAAGTGADGQRSRGRLGGPRRRRRAGTADGAVPRRNTISTAT